MDGDNNVLISQAFTFNSEGQLISLHPNILKVPETIDYVLEFDWGIRKTSSLLSYQGVVVVNNKIVSFLHPKIFDLVINHETINVKLAPGVNTISFDGAGLSDGYGIVIDNVKLTTNSNKTNIVNNGDF